MNILFVLSKTPKSADSDGVARWFYNVIRVMRPLVKSLDVIGQHFGDDIFAPWLDQYTTKFLSIPAKNHRSQRYKWLIGWDSHKMTAFNPDVLVILQKWVLLKKYDLVIYFGNGTHVYLPYIQNVKTLAVPLDAPSGFSYKKSGNIKNWLMDTLNYLASKRSERSLNQASCVLVVSNRDKVLLLNSGVHIPVYVCAMGVDTDEFTPIQMPRDKSMLFTGVLDFYPNVDAITYLIEDIYLPFQLEQKKILCKIAGKSPSGLLDKFSRTPGVRWFINQPDLRPIFSASSLYIAPMRTGLGMKNKVLEAMSMEMPIIGSSLAFNGIERPEEFALVCNDPQETVNSINSLLDDPSLALALGKKARLYAQNHHGIERVAKLILSLA